MNEVYLAPLTVQHIPAITSIHIEAFPERALTVLGEKAVARYYDTLLHRPSFCLSIGAFEDEHLLGYLIGGEMRGSMRSFLKDHLAYLAFRIVTHPWLLAKPIIRDRVSLALGQIKARRRRVGPPRHDGKMKTFSVLVIAVDPTLQHKGVGKLLMARAEQAAVENGYPRMHLSVDVENAQAIHFYERLDWRKDREEGGSLGMVKMLIPDGAAERESTSETVKV